MGWKFYSHSSDLSNYQKVASESANSDFKILTKSQFSNSKVLGSIPRWDENFILIPVISVITKKLQSIVVKCFIQTKMGLESTHSWVQSSYASCEVWTHDPWFTRPVLYHWAKEATIMISFKILDMLATLCG